jgi:hypothetical protein
MSFPDNANANAKEIRSHRTLELITLDAGTEF